MAYAVSTGTRFAISTTLGAAIPVTAISNASPAVITAAAHGLAQGAPFLLKSGWEDLNDSVLQAGVVATNTITLVAADLLDELNARIADPDFLIGPSYFMRPATSEPGGLERVWRTSILPLLEEHHYGEGVDVEARYGLAAVRAALGSRD